MKGVSKGATKNFVEETLNRYIDCDSQLKEKYNDSNSQVFLRDSLKLRYDLLIRLKNDLMLDSEVIWGEEDSHERITEIKNILKTYHDGGYKTGYEHATVEALLEIGRIVDRF